MISSLLRRFGGRRMRAWRLVALVVATVLVGVFRNWPSDLPDHVDGRARIVDGDSLRVAGEEIRLLGIDAPEARQDCERNGQRWACGRQATQALKAAIGRRAVRCDVDDLDKYNRLLAICFQGDVDLNAAMVRDGWAVSYGRYRGEEAAARDARRGIWSGEFQQPRQWRDENMTGAVAADAS